MQEGGVQARAASLAQGDETRVRFAEPPDRRNPITVRELITLAPHGWKESLDRNPAIPRCGGLIAQAANRFLSRSRLLNFRNRTFSGTAVKTLRKELRCFGTNIE